MKKIALLALTLACVSSSAAAQAAKTEAKSKAAAQPTPKAAAKPVWTKHLAEHFAGANLTADQKVKIAAANKKHHDAMDKIKATEKNDSIAKAQIKGHQDAEHAEFHEILSAEQYAVFEKNMVKMEARKKADAKMKKDGKMDHDNKMDHDKMSKMDKMDHDKMEKAPAKPVKRP